MFKLWREMLYVQLIGSKGRCVFATYWFLRREEGRGGNNNEYIEWIKHGVSGLF